MPRIERQSPPYVQITDHYRAQIVDGVLPPGSRLPGVHDLAREWGVSPATAAKALGQLGVEGLITTSPRGSYVAELGAEAASPQDRVLRVVRSGTADAQGESHKVTAAEKIPAPGYVAELYGIEPGDPIIRREWITTQNKSIRRLTVTWHPASLAEGVPELLSTDGSKVGGLLRRIQEVTGPIQEGRDFHQGRGADSREAGHLGLPVGAAILASTWMLWTSSDEEEEHLVEYGECCLPARATVTYSYSVKGEKGA